MSLLTALTFGPNGPNYSPSTSNSCGGSCSFSMLSAMDQQTPSAQPLITPMSIPGAPPYTSPGFTDIPLVSQAFGPLPTGFGVATKDGVIQIDTEAFEGNIEGGQY